MRPHLRARRGNRILRRLTLRPLEPTPAVPPNDADDTEYTRAARNMSHRYASRVAEHTCSAKLAEAELALLEAREAEFTLLLSL